MQLVKDNSTQDNDKKKPVADVAVISTYLYWILGRTSSSYRQLTCAIACRHRKKASYETVERIAQADRGLAAVDRNQTVTERS